MEEPWYEFDTMCPLDVPKHMNHEICGHSDSSSGTWLMLLWARVC